MKSDLANEETAPSGLSSISAWMPPGPGNRPPRLGAYSAELVRDQARDRKRRRGGGRRRVADVEAAPGPRDDEVVDERSVAGDRLGPDPDGPGLEVFRPQLRDEPLRLLDEPARADRVAELGQAVTPMPAGEAPGAGPGERSGEAARWPQQHDSVVAAGQVRAEEGQRRVGDRIDVPPDQIGAVGSQAEVRAADRHDARAPPALRSRWPAGPSRSRADHEGSRRGRSSRVFDLNRRPLVADTAYLAGVSDGAAAGGEVLGEGGGHAGSRRCRWRVSGAP